MVVPRDVYQLVSAVVRVFVTILPLPCACKASHPDCLNKVKITQDCRCIQTPECRNLNGVWASKIKYSSCFYSRKKAKKLRRC